MGSTYVLISFQVVLSPRVLAPSLAATSNSSSGTALFNRLTSSFGYLNRQVGLLSASRFWVENKTFYFGILEVPVVCESLH